MQVLIVFFYKTGSGGLQKKDKNGDKKKSILYGMLFKKDWRRPTFPQINAVSSAMTGLTSLFGMGRGGHRLHSHQNILFGTLAQDIRESYGKSSGY